MEYAGTQDSDFFAQHAHGGYRPNLNRTASAMQTCITEVKEALDNTLLSHSLFIQLKPT